MFIDDMRTLFPNLEMQIQFEPSQDEHIGVFVNQDNGPTVPLDAAGTSVLQASQLLGYVSLFTPKLLILDEPDSHLHPDRQRQLCRLLCDIADKRDFQIILSSHSRHVLDALGRRANVIWLSKGAAVSDNDVDTQKMLLDLGALDSVDYLANGQIRCLVATEDTNKTYIRALLEASGFPIEDVEIVSYPGCSQVEAAIVLGCFLKEKAPTIQLVVHRDGDYLSPQNIADFKSRLAAKGIHSWVTDCNDIEGYFADPNHLYAANPSLSLERIQDLRARAVEDSREASIKSIVNLRTQQAFRERNRGGTTPDHGQIAVDSARDFNASPSEMSRGDVLLGRLTSLLQSEMGTNPRVIVVTDHLNVPSLREIRDQIWVPPPPSLNA